MRTAGFGDSACTATSGVSPTTSRIDSYLISRRSRRLLLLRRRSAQPSSSRPFGPALSARDRGEDGDDVAVRHLGAELVEVPDVVVVAVHVDELVDAPRLVDELARQPRVAGGEVGEHIAHR